MHTRGTAPSPFCIRSLLVNLIVKLIFECQDYLIVVFLLLVYNSIAEFAPSAENHIRGLKKDTGYFAEFLGERSEHRPEKLLDVLGNQHSSLDKSLFWELVIENVVSDAHGALTLDSSRISIMIWRYVFHGLVSMGIKPTYIKTTFRNFQRRHELFDSIHINVKGIGLADFGSSAEGRFHYPSEKRRNEQNRESKRKAEQNLDGFWQKTDEVYQRNTGQTLNQAVKHICTVVPSLERIPEWVEAINVPKTNPQERTGRDEASPIPQFDSDDTTKFIAPQPKSKPKTRGSAITTKSPTPLAAAAPAATPTPTPDSQPTFKPKARAIKVFRVLFREIPWANFLYAMTSTSFAAEKQYGSVWQFTPTKLDIEWSIQFHEPYPPGKIAFRTVRRTGRRLGRSYDWGGDASEVKFGVH
ncbi:uncharacterized protein Bfra_008067 [Botrytis fragariae]|uniref:Uncharacterized protein n=1 Tax=Botrytis fragariae TaxID=1964551 RepID=A0A8H6EGP3_9HELO|nr:uncharacterized protein Bfra_008067 [Botrytis fragariae]KAF5871548.1 hypothetical protein Bfra_008067 [Botrytis fragariae]